MIRRGSWQARWSGVDGQVGGEVTALVDAGGRVLALGTAFSAGNGTYAWIEPSSAR